MEDSNPPLISIGMPVYNGGDLLREAVDSLLAQEMPNFELIISDNASTDATGRICLEYAARDSRIRYFRNDTNIGAFPNFERTVDLAHGRYFMWASHDDFWYPGFLSACLIPYESSDIVLAYPDSVLFDPTGVNTVTVTHKDIPPTAGIKDPVERLRRIYRGSDFWVLFYGLMPTQIVRKLIPIPRVRGNDAAFVALLSLMGEFAHVPEVLFRFRRKEQSLKRRQGANWLGSAEAKTAKTYVSFRPTAAAICKHVRRMPLTRRQKLSACMETIRWWATEQDVLSPKTRKLLKRIGRVSPTEIV